MSESESHISSLHLSVINFFSVVYKGDTRSCTHLLPTFMLPLLLFLIRALGFFASVQAASHDHGQVPFPLYDDTTPPIITVPPAAWAALNASVGGRLFPGVPFAKPCFPEYKGWVSSVDTEECEQVKKSYRNECESVSQCHALVIV